MKLQLPKLIATLLRDTLYPLGTKNLYIYHHLSHYLEAWDYLGFPKNEKKYSLRKQNSIEIS